MKVNNECVSMNIKLDYEFIKNDINSTYTEDSVSQIHGELSSNIHITEDRSGNP